MSKRFCLGLLICCALSGCATPPQPNRLLEAYRRETRLSASLAEEGQLFAARETAAGALAQAFLIDDPVLTGQALITLAGLEQKLALPAACARFAQAAEEAAALPSGPAPLRLRWQALLGQADCARRQGDPVQGLAFLAALPDAAALAPDEQAAFAIHRDNLSALFALGRKAPTQALAIIEQAHDRALALGDPRLLAATLANRAEIRAALADPDAALADAQRALALDRARFDPAATADAHALLARLLRPGQPALAHAHARRALAIYALTGQHAQASLLRGEMNETMRADGTADGTAAHAPLPAGSPQ